MGIGCALRSFRDMEKASQETINGMSNRFKNLESQLDLREKPTTDRERAFLFFFTMNMK